MLQTAKHMFVYGFLYLLHVHATFATSSSFRSSFLQQMSQPHLQTTSLSIVDLPQGFQSDVESMKDTRQKLLSLEKPATEQLFHGEIAVHFVHPLNLVEGFKGQLFPTSLVWSLARVTLVDCWVGQGYIGHIQPSSFNSPETCIYIPSTNIH